MNPKTTIDLTGKVALVTGASRGIGREAAIRLGAAGAKVAINYVNNAALAAEVAALVDGSIVVQGDVGNGDDARKIVGEVIARFGRIDILVNNAAIYGDNRFDADDYDAWRRGWQRTFDVNLFGAANLAWLCMRHMRAQGGGKIINVSSRAAWRGETDFADYGASKAALVNLTKSIARACAKYGITSSCIAPGFTMTEMAADAIANDPSIVESIPMGRVATVDDCAAAILYLASEWGDYLNGATLDLNGGSYVR